MESALCSYSTIQIRFLVEWRVSLVEGREEMLLEKEGGRTDRKGRGGRTDSQKALLLGGWGGVAMENN